LKLSERDFLKTAKLFFALCIAGVCLIAAGALVGSTAQAAPPATPPPESGVAGEPRLVIADERGLVLELLTPAFRVESANTADGGQPCSHLVVDGYGKTDAAGYPELPVRGAMLGIPAQANVSLTVLEVETILLPDRYDLCPVPSPIVDAEPSDEIHYQGSQLIRDARVYASAEFAPASPAELVSTGFIRSQRVAQVRFQPFQYNPASGQVRQVRRIRVRLAFDGSYGSQAAGPMSQAAGPADEGPFEDVLRHTLVNYAGARAWRVAPRPVLPAAGAQSAGAASCKIMVNKDGLYQVTPADLQAACPDASGADPRTFRLTNRGQDVALHVEGESDGSFGPGDVLLFYGVGLDTKYTDTNVYWLTWDLMWDGTDRPRMPWIDGTPSGTESTPAYFSATQHLEQNKLYQSARPSGPENDHWYWDYIIFTGSPPGGPSAPSIYTTTLQHLATAPLSATLRGSMMGYSADLQHHTRVYLNGNVLEDAAWPPQTEHPFQIAIPQSYLIEGTNTISVVTGIDGATDVVLTNWFAIDYYVTYTAEDNLLSFGGDQAGTWEYQVGGFTAPEIELYDITAPVSPTRILSATVQGGGPYTLTFQQAITGAHRYLALAPTQWRSPLRIERDRPSDLHSASPGADYIIITHGDFYTATLALAERRATHRPAVVVDVQDIYDEFNAGIFDPAAIHEFLAYAYATWAPPAPAYVLLVGDGNYDFRDYLGYIGLGEPNYVPPYLADVDPVVGETAADNRYVCVSGDDILPDMHLGRLPAKTAAQAEAMVAKIVAYEQAALVEEDWNKQILFVADNVDEGGDFPLLSDNVVDHYTPAPYVTQKIYYGVTYTSPAAARTAIVGAINAGQRLVNYVGHGAIQYWAQEQLLSVSAISSLANAGRLPFVVPMTCLEGYYILPGSATLDRSSLAESIVRVPEKGAIASWSATGEGLADGHDFLDRGLFQALFFDGVDQIGPATTQAKLYLYGNTGEYRDLLDAYVLFGDPALQLPVLKADLDITKTVVPAAAVQSGDTVTYTLTYANAGPATAHHVVISDTLPEALRDPSVTWAGAVITSRVGSRFVWDVADLAAGQGGIITITAVVSPTLADAPIDNTATITATVVETNTANNSSSVRIIAAPYIYYLPIVTKNSTR
jgi:uncharacterized repeat protein (TIGR01451 family)